MKLQVRRLSGLNLLVSYMLTEEAGVIQQQKSLRMSLRNWNIGWKGFTITPSIHLANIYWTPRMWQVVFLQLREWKIAMGAILGNLSFLGWQQPEMYIKLHLSQVVLHWERRKLHNYYDQARFSQMWQNDISIFYPKRHVLCFDMS